MTESSHHGVRPEVLTPQLVPIEQLVPHPRNPRRGDVRRLREGMSEFGQYQPVLARRQDRQILARNHVYLTAKSLGWTHVAVIWLDALDQERALRLLLWDNKSGDDSTYDEQELADILSELRETDTELAATGWSDTELDKLLDRLEDQEQPHDSGAKATYTTSYEIVVECANEDEQRELYERWRTEGLRCRVLTM